MPVTASGGAVPITRRTKPPWRSLSDTVRPPSHSACTSGARSGGRPCPGGSEYQSRVERADIVDQVPSIVLREDVGETGHGETTLGRLDAVRQPPEQIAIAVHPQMDRR